MKKFSSLPSFLTPDQLRAAELLLSESHITLQSCLFWWMDSPVVIQPRTLHESFFYIPVTGRIRCRIGEEEREIGPGEFMMVGDGVEHQALLAEDSQALEVFALHAYTYTHQAKPLLSFFQDPVGHLDHPESWFNRLRLLTHLLANRQATGIAYGGSLLRELLIHQVIRGNALIHQPHPGDARIWDSIQLILNEGHLPLTVTDLARRAGLGVVQYRKLFQQAVGQSPKTYIRHTRLTRARALLETDPHMPLKEVADRAGFSDARYLHQVFREQHGTTPGRYRNRRHPTNN